MCQVKREEGMPWKSKMVEQDPEYSEKQQEEEIPLNMIHKYLIRLKKPQVGGGE